MTESPQPALHLNALSSEAAREALARCCGAKRWVEKMLARRPFASRSELLLAADQEWAELAPEDVREAFAHHPDIGASLEQAPQSYASTLDLARAEQSGAMGASAETRRALKDGNAAYRARFGHAFIICATGKSAEQMLASLETRLAHSAELELGIAAAEQAKITRLRLEKLERIEPVTP